MRLDPAKNERLKLISDAAREMRQLAEAANTDEERIPYGDDRHDPVPEGDWGKLLVNYVGGAMATHAAAWPPRTAIALAELLARFLADYETDEDVPECAGCGSGCWGHPPILYHPGCGEDVDGCLCLEPYLTIAGIFLSRGVPMEGGA